MLLLPLKKLNDKYELLPVNEYPHTAWYVTLRNL